MSKTAIAALLLAPAITFAWDGRDSESGSAVEIERGNLVRPGESIEVYNYETGQYQNVDVESVERNGSSVDVEVYDSDSGEYHTLEMEE